MHMVSWKEGEVYGAKGQWLLSLRAHKRTLQGTAMSGMGILAKSLSSCTCMCARKYMCTMGSPSPHTHLG